MRLIAFPMVILLMIVLSPKVAAFPTLAVSIFTDSLSYNPGEAVTLFGHVTDTNGFPVSVATVSIQVNDPVGTTLHITLLNSLTDGSYQDTFNLPLSAANGMYIAYVTAYKYQWNPGSSSVLFAVPRTSLSSLGSRIFGAAANTVYFIYPDWDHANLKLPGVGLAALSDWSAMGILYGMCSNVQNDGLDTRSTLVDLSSGSPVFTGSGAVLMGGPAVHNFVFFYEGRKLAPLYFSQDGTAGYFRKRDGSVVSSMLLSEAASLHKDLFLLEAFTDLKGNTVFIGYGVTWKGTFAAGLYLKSVIAPNLASYSHAWYVLSWQDVNGDGMIDLNEIFLVASGG